MTEIQGVRELQLRELQQGDSGPNHWLAAVTYRAVGHHKNSFVSDCFARELVLGAKTMLKNYIQGKIQLGGGDLWQARVAMRVTH